MQGDLNAMVPGKLITAVFGFCIIEDFTETCSYLGSDITRYINTVAQIIHGNTHMYYGAANKNIGCAFLLCWKLCDGRMYGLRDPRDPDQSRLPEEELKQARKDLVVVRKGRGKKERKLQPCPEVVDAALTAFIKSIYDVHQANQSGGAFDPFNLQLRGMAAKGEMHEDDRETFQDFHVHMGFGMHIGWAIEGAIGSQYKIDASYLSPNVNMSARLEAATHQFGTELLLSEWIVAELSPAARQKCRLIDRICVVGSKIPMEIWTVDIFNWNIENFLHPDFSADGTQRSVDFATNAHLSQMSEGMDARWRPLFDEGITAYLAGDWPLAIKKLEEAKSLNPTDGPTKSCLKQMKVRGNVAPEDWLDEKGRGFRQLTSK